MESVCMAKAAHEEFSYRKKVGDSFFKHEFLEFFEIKMPPSLIPSAVLLVFISSKEVTEQLVS
jgi:hypothetical protein